MFLVRVRAYTGLIVIPQGTISIFKQKHQGCDCILTGYVRDQLLGKATTATILMIVNWKCDVIINETMHFPCIHARINFTNFPCVSAPVAALARLESICYFTVFEAAIADSRRCKVLNTTSKEMMQARHSVDKLYCSFLVGFVELVIHSFVQELTACSERRAWNFTYLVMILCHRNPHLKPSLHEFWPITVTISIIDKTHYSHASTKL